MADELVTRTLAELSRLIRKKEISPVELTEQTLTRIGRVDPQLNSYITVLADTAKEEARCAAQEILAGNYRGPLHGIPLSVKDMFAMRGIRTTCASKILADWVPNYDATAVVRLRAAGAVIVGKTNMHEFAFGATTDSPHFGPTRNPWDRCRVAGGSSGGSAAAVAASLCAASIGSDGGGSIRIPSAVCGTVGLKPTYGRISRHGAIPLAWSLDHIGPIARSVEDAAHLLAVLAGPDAKDKTASDHEVPQYAEALSGRIEGIRVGVPQQYFFDHMDAEILAAVQTATTTLEHLGAQIVPVSLPYLENCAAMTAHITLAEAAAYHEPYLKARADDYGADVRIELEAGRYLLATDYVKSQRARALLQQVFADALERVDVIVSPTVPAFPPSIGDSYVQSGDIQEWVVQAFIRFNIPFNLTGLPAISIPCGFSSAGLPIGVQIAGRPFDESTILRVAHTYELHTDWHTLRPPL